MKCNIKQIKSDPKISLYQSLHKKEVKKRRKISDIYTYNSYIKYHNIIDQLDLIIRLYINGEKYNFAKPIYHEESMQFKILLPYKPINYNKISKIVLIISSEYLQFNKEMCVFDKLFQNMKSNHIPDPDSDFVNFYELPFQDSQHSFSLIGLYEPDIISYYVVVINYIDIILRFDKYLIVLY